MASKNKNPNSRSKAQQRNRTRTSAAAARARQQKQKRRGIISGAVAAVIVLAIVVLLLNPGGSSKSTATTSASTSSTSTPATTAAAASVAGKPCVAVSSPLPKGAPAVAVQVGPPPTTLVKKDLKVGTGAVVTASQTVTVDYIGVACSTGKIFDSSYSRNQAATFPLTGVIPGWTQGIPGMKVGGERLLGIPPALGYGSSGSPPDIAPDETLWFVVHVISAK